MFSRIYIMLLVMFITSPSYAEPTRVVPEAPPQLTLSYAPLVKKVAPAVVNIYTKRTVSTGFRSPFMDDPFFERFFGGSSLFGAPMRERVESSLGSGVIVAESGLVITNAHVVRGAQEITVVLKDGNEYEASLLLSDKASDLALLSIENVEGVEFPYVTLKPSESLEVGDLVLAIGNPFGVGQTVTSGIVSAQGRSSLNINDYNFFIQTDAAINPGNSGGPLVAMDGGVVGINTAIFSRNGGSMGLGFSIPSEMVVSVIAAARNGQSGDNGIIRPWLGVTAQDVTPDIAASLGLPNPNGAMIADLHTASPLKAAGVKAGDIIVKVNGTHIRNAAEMKFRMATVPIGKVVSATVFSGGKTRDVTIEAIAPPDIPPRQETVLSGQHVLNGATVAILNPAVAVELGMAVEGRGVVVLNVVRGTYAARAVKPGDILLEINGMEIISPSDIDKAFGQKTEQGGVSLVTKRGERVSRMYMR